MSKKELLIKELEHIPETLLNEVLDYLHFSKNKVNNGGLETAIASEPALERDWMKPEEDEAWKNL